MSRSNSGPTISTKKIAVFLDVFQEKNRLQYRLMSEFGFESIWFQTQAQQIPDISTIEVLKPGLVSRLLQIILFFQQNKKALHHVEIYPGGRFAFLYMLVAKLYGVPVLCCERGDLLYYVNKTYNRITRMSLYLVYRFSDYLWLKELFAEDYLKKLKIHRSHFFIHNVVPVPSSSAVKSPQERDIDFLWVNSLKSFRMVDWFSKALDEPEFQETHNVLLGLTESKLQDEYNHIDSKKNLDVLGFISPKDFFSRARFFVMPASIVYLNHALLEAMSYGVVPIITEAQGSSLIIDHNNDGFITAFTQEAFIQQMKDVLTMNSVDYERLSEGARNKVIKEFSETYYKNRLKEMYDAIK